MARYETAGLGLNLVQGKVDGGEVWPREVRSEGLRRGQQRRQIRRHVFIDDMVARVGSGEHRRDEDKLAQTEFANNNASVGRVLHVPLGATRAPCPKKMSQLDKYCYYEYTI